VNAARDASGSRFPGGGVTIRRIGDEGSNGERDVRRCPPTLHSWAHYCRGKRGQGKRCKRDERRYPPTLLGSVPSSLQGSRERRCESRKRLRKIGSCSSLYSQKKTIPTQLSPAVARNIRKKGEEGEFAGPGPEG
jgi:hypothetical protein